MNAVADLVARRALEENRELLYFDEAFTFGAWFGSGHRSLHLILSSDGACSLDGRCAVGVVISVVEPPLVQVHVQHILACETQNLCPKRVVACFGCIVPGASCVEVEFEACCRARRFLIEWLIFSRFVQ